MKRLFGFLVGLVCAGIVLLVLYFHFVPLPSKLIRTLERLELRTADYRMKFSKKPRISDAIKIVLVNDVTNLDEKLARFTQFISTTANGSYKPKVIGFNYLFDVDVVNEELITAASLSRNVYYGYYFLLPPLQQAAPQTNNQDILPFRKEITDMGNGIHPVLTAQDVQLPSAKYLATAGGIGFVNVHADSVDNICRRIPLFLQFQDHWYGSLALLIAMEYMDIDSVDITFYPGQYYEIVQEEGDIIKIPVNQYGEMLIDFAYTPDNTGLAPFETFTMEDILAAAAQPEVSPDQAKRFASLKDKIVLVGTAGPQSAASLAIPQVAAYPLIGVHANVINNILSNQFVQEISSEWAVGLILLASMLTGLFIANGRLVAKVAFGIVMMLVYVLIAYVTFFQFRLLLPVLTPLCAMGLTIMSVIAFVRQRSPAAARTVSQPQQPLPEKKRKSPEDLTTLENQLLETREEVDRKSVRLRSKVEELRLLQEQGEAKHHDYTGQVAALQKEIRAREIELKNLVVHEEELRRQLENLPLTDAGLAQFKQNTEKIRQFFAKRGMVTNHAQMLYTLYRAEKLGKTSVTLLLQGENGTGKNILARTIKELSPRHNRPILEVICAGDMDLLEDDLFGHKRGAFPGAEEARNGYLREMDGGTIVLEEIENLSLEIQTRLMQMLRGKVVYPLGEDRGYPVDVRVIATTSRNVKDLVAEGKFREDLYHYFSVFTLLLPPLRDRKEDIPLLVNYFVQKYNRVHSKVVETVSDEALNLLVTHQWPGNLAELEKVMERTIAEVNPGVKELTEQQLSLEDADLSGGITDAGMLNYLIALMDPAKELPSYQQLREKVLVEIQRLYCARLLRIHNGNIKNAAIDTGLKEDTFKKMLSELQIDPENYRI